MEELYFSLIQMGILMPKYLEKYLHSEDQSYPYVTVHLRHGQSVPL